MASNYTRGRAKEWEVQRILEACGYSTIRAASSKGLWDVMGVCARDSRLVQVKLTSQPSFSEDENCREFRDLHVPPLHIKELWIFRARKGLAEVRDLSEPKHHARSPEGKAQRERWAAAATQFRLLRAIKDRKG